MKRTAIMLLALLMAAGTAYGNAGGPISAGVTSNSVMILPQRGLHLRSVSDWAATNLYNNGDLREANSKIYMMYGTNGSTSGTTAPSHAFGLGSDGTLQWYAVPSGNRKGASIYNISSVDVFLSLGFTASTNAGHYLKANGGTFQLDDAFQGPIFAISVGATSNTITIQEH